MNLCYNKSIDQTAMTTAAISDFMTTRIEAISPSSSVQKAATKMTDRDVCSLVVIDDKDSKVLGLIPERDIIRNLYIYDNVSINRTSVFHPPLIFTTLIHPQRATDLLIENKIRHLLVVDKEESTKP
jgi:CBS domain-containing protein